jgi:hypothetical protein
VDQQFARWVMLHVESNPLPICTRPRVLIKGNQPDGPRSRSPGQRTWRFPTPGITPFGADAE